MTSATLLLTLLFILVSASHAVLLRRVADSPAERLLPKNSKGQLLQNPFLGKPGHATTRCACCACKKAGGNRAPGGEPVRLKVDKTKTLIPRGAVNEDHMCYATPCDKNPGKYCWVTRLDDAQDEKTAVSCDNLDPPFDEATDCGYQTCSTHHKTDKCACCACNRAGEGGGYHSCATMPCKSKMPAVNMKTGAEYTPFCWSPLKEDGGTSCGEVLSQDDGFSDCRACLDDGNLPLGKDAVVDDEEMAALKANCSVTRGGCGPTAR